MQTNEFNHCLGGGHNLINKFIVFFYVSDNFEDFEGFFTSLFFMKKTYYFDGWGGKFHEIFF